MRVVAYFNKKILAMLVCFVANPHLFAISSYEGELQNAIQGILKSGVEQLDKQVEHISKLLTEKNVPYYSMSFLEQEIKWVADQLEEQVINRQIIEGFASKKLAKQVEVLGHYIRALEMVYISLLLAKEYKKSSLS